MRSFDGQLSGAGGRRIYWQSWLPVRTSFAVVIAHGACEHSGRYQRLAEYLLEQGAAVYALDHRGHGRSEGSRAYLDRFEHACQDIDQVVEMARQAHRGRPLFLLGHSLGGALALRYALKRQGKLAGLVLSSPAVALDGVPSGLMMIARLLSVVAPRTPLYPIAAQGISRDPAEVTAYQNDALIYRGKIPARTVVELASFLEWLPAALPALRLPLLVLHGTADTLAPDTGGKRVHAAAGSLDKSLQLYEGGYHELFNELPGMREQVCQDLSRWLKRQQGKY
ncbi:alpha/beta hydrolase [Solimonas sp. K1W22B-7]|uniref:alpha/beta hydrolase n=1 Tax=Solimonas sp. K1W22B-7 TaxID=2303331 RepID=UPI0013C4F688|nr:alpha/beta hydrolase [Solimonas sp. K1W22B-7]